MKLMCKYIDSCTKKPCNCEVLTNKCDYCTLQKRCDKKELKGKRYGERSTIL